MRTTSDGSQLIHDLWGFVENVNDDDPKRSDTFFALRERVRSFYARAEQRNDGCREQSWPMNQRPIEELPDDLKPPLLPQAVQDSTRPVPPPGPRWWGDRGAIPGEPTYFLDQDANTEEAAITPWEVSGGGLLFDVLLSDGRLLGTYDDLRIAAAAGEYAVDHRNREVSIWSNLPAVILTLQYCLETFEQTCACGRCDPCTRGQEDIRQAIRTVEELLQPATGAPAGPAPAELKQDGT